MDLGAPVNYCTVISFHHGYCISAAIFNNSGILVCRDFDGGTLVKPQPNYNNIFFSKLSITFKLVNINYYNSTTTAPPHNMHTHMHEYVAGFPHAMQIFDLRKLYLSILCCCLNLLEQFALFSRSFLMCVLPQFRPHYTYYCTLPVIFVVLLLLLASFALAAINIQIL